jgi:hypothetical protein
LEKSLEIDFFNKSSALISALITFFPIFISTLIYLHLNVKIYPYHAILLSQVLL